MNTQADKAVNSSASSSSSSASSSSSVSQEIIFTDYYAESKGFIYLQKIRVKEERKAWELIGCDFTPNPEFGSYKLRGRAYNQRQIKLEKFNLSSDNLQQVFDRLKVLHRHLVHGDLKGEHIRTNSAGEIVFIDLDACSLANSTFHTPQYASLELLLAPQTKRKVDDLEAVLWACYQKEMQQEPIDGNRLQDLIVARLTSMSQILNGFGSLKLRAAFAHVWLLSRANDLTAKDYLLPQALDSFNATVQEFQLKLTKLVMELKNTDVQVLNTKDPGNLKGYLDESKLALEWPTYFDEKIKRKLTDADIKLWTRLRKNSESTDYDLLLFNNQFDHSELRQNVQPRPHVAGFDSDKRQAFIDAPTGTLVVFETSVAEKSLVEVFEGMEQLLPRPYRPLHVLLAFSCVILRHKETKSRISFNDDTLSRCMKAGNLASIVLAASGRFVIYAQTESNIAFVHLIAQDISRDRETISRYQENEEAVESERETLRTEKASLQKEKELFQKEKELFLKKEELFLKKEEALQTEKDDFRKKKELHRQERARFQKEKEEFQKEKEEFQREKEQLRKI